MATATQEIERAKDLAQRVVDNEGNIFLRELVRGLGDPEKYPARRTASQLRDVINLAIDDGKITHNSLSDWLTSVQGWGREWVYLWSIPKKSATNPSWNASDVRALLPDGDWRDAFVDEDLAQPSSPGNEANPIDTELLTDFSETFSIQRIAFADKTLTFEWHQSWPRLIREKDYDFEDSDRDEVDTIVFHAHRKTERRAVVRLQIKPKLGLIAAFMQVPEGQEEHREMLKVCAQTAEQFAPATFKPYLISKLILAWDAKQLEPGNDDIWTGKSRLANSSGYLEVGSSVASAGYRSIESLQLARAVLLKSDFDGRKATMHFRIPTPDAPDRVVSSVFDGPKNRFKLRAQMTEQQVWDFIAKITKLPKPGP